MEKDKEGNLYFTESELKELLTKELGHGTDGRVIKFNNKELIKFYHSKLRKFKVTNSKTVDDLEENDDLDVKIYDSLARTKFNNVNFEEMFSYYSKDMEDDYVKIRSAEAVNLAIKRQQKVIKTRLPKGAVYVDGKFIGCVLIASHGLQIHKMTGCPYKLKKQIMLKVLDNVQELLDNCIYHVDLDNSPYTTKAKYINDLGVIEEVGHSHILVNPITLEPQIIDLDGKSTIYTNFKSEKLEKRSLGTYINLLLEFLLKINLDEYEDDEEIASELERIGISADYIKMLINKSMNVEELRGFINSYDGKERRL